MANLDARILALETKLKQAKAQKQRTEARLKAAETKRKRAKDTRRKILVGALILDRVERGEWPKEKLTAMLEDFLTRTDDRELFGLSQKS